MTLITDLIQIIYASQPFGYDIPTLSGILLDARTCNTRDGVTGALICRNDIYLQLLEGPPPQVRAALTRIRRDDRHANVKTVLSEPVSSRLFGEWSMLHDPAKSVMWDPSEIATGAIERARPSDYRRLFETLAESVKDGE